MNGAIRVLLCVNHALLRAALRGFLSIQGDMEVVGETGSGEEALERVAMLRPHVVVMDVDLTGTNGLETTRRVTRQFPGCKVLVLTMHPSSYCRIAQTAGASGCVPKSYLDTALAGGIRAAHASRSSGHTPACPIYA